MSSSTKLYDKITLPSATNNNREVSPKMYKGFSTVSLDTENFSLYDLDLIKQDLINHFYVRQGERLMNPTFGTIIWDLLFEPLTEQIKNLILQNVNQIINYDPRIKADKVTVTAYESGIQIECLLTYLPYNVSQSMKLKFDQANGLLAQ
jgi:phage baseplate assembly protein W